MRRASAGGWRGEGRESRINKSKIFIAHLTKTHQILKLREMAEVGRQEMMSRTLDFMAFTCKVTLIYNCTYLLSLSLFPFLSAFLSFFFFRHPICARWRDSTVIVIKQILGCLLDWRRRYPLSLYTRYCTHQYRRCVKWQTVSWENEKRDWNKVSLDRYVYYFDKKILKTKKKRCVR